MPDVTQNVFIEFITDTSKLEPGVDALERMGKVEKEQANSFKATNAEINKQQKALEGIGVITKKIDETGKVTKTNLRDLAKIIKGQSESFQKEIKAGIIDALKQAGVSVKQFEKLLDDSLDPEPVISLRSQLKKLVDELGALELAGQTNTEQYKKLAAQAVVVKKAMDDVGESIKSGASDTSAIDGVIQTVGTLAGGFAVAQGTAALFGDESEELQKTLLKVNAAMAILQGLQQIQNALQKESAAAQFANTLATKAQAAAQVVYNFVVGASTGLLKAFKIALAATGIGLFIIAIAKLVELLNEENRELEDANALIESQKNLMNSFNETIQRTIDLEEARARAAEASESEIIRIQGRSLLKQRAVLKETQDNLVKQRDALSATSEAWFVLNQEIQKNANLIAGIDNQIVITSINLEAKLADEQKEARKKRADDLKKHLAEVKKNTEERLQKEKEARAAGFADFKASVELELLEAEKGSEEELEIKKRLLRAELQQALDNEKLTFNQRKLLIQKFFKDRIQLEKDFGKDRHKIAIENIASDIQAELQGLELSNERRLELTETAIKLQAALEIEAADGVAEKITEINAKRDKAIRDARIASIEETLAFELSVAEVGNAAHLRAIQKQLDNEKTGLRERIGLIDELTGVQLNANFKRIAALNNERQQGLISQKDYNLKYAQLIEEQVKIVEDGEKKKTDATTNESQRRIDQFKAEVDTITKVAEVVADILGGIADLQAERENQKIASDRQRIKDLQDAGAITEKQAIARMKKLDAEERAIKQKQAQRDKAIALFQAIINTARGVASAIPDPFLIALAAAVGAAQITLIASKPIPRFAKGKKGSYEGLGQVGEAGSELIEKNGRMFVTDKPTIVYLGKKDKVYSHKETVEMLSKPQMSTERNGVMIAGNKGIQIDYERMGKEVGKHVQQTIMVDGVTAQIIKEKEFTKYLDGRRSF